jgi:hypothetical protein
MLTITRVIPYDYDVDVAIMSDKTIKIEEILNKDYKTSDFYPVIHPQWRKDPRERSAFTFNGPNLRWMLVTYF